MKEKFSQALTYADVAKFVTVGAIIVPAIIFCGVLIQIVQSTSDDVKDLKPKVNQIATDLNTLTVRYNSSQAETDRRRANGETTFSNPATQSGKIALAPVPTPENKNAIAPTSTPKPEPKPTPVDNLINNILGLLNR